MTTKTPKLPPGWQKLVDEGRHIVRARQAGSWALGDIALRLCPPGESLALLVLYAREVGLRYQTLVIYRTVAKGWPKDKRVPGAAWRTHQALLGLEDKEQKLADFAEECREDGVRLTYTLAVAVLIDRDADAVLHAISRLSNRLTEIGEEAMRLRPEDRLRVAAAFAKHEAKTRKTAESLMPIRRVG